MTHPYGTWLIHMRCDSSTCVMCEVVCDSFAWWYMCMTWSIYVWHDSSTFDMTHPHVTWLIHAWNDSHDPCMCDMTRPHLTRPIHMWHDSSMRDMTHPHVWWIKCCVGLWSMASLSVICTYVCDGSHMCAMARWYITYVCHGSLIFATCLKYAIQRVEDS